MLKSPLFWKITTLIGCIVLLSLPLMMVRELINERADYRSEVVDAIEQSTSGSQKLAGPLIAIPITETLGISGDGAGIHMPMPALAEDNKPLEIAFSLDLNGTGEFSLVPLGRNSELQLTSNWPHPGFLGSFLPTQREVSAAGYRAHWQSSWFANDMGSYFKDDMEIPWSRLPAFSADVMSLADQYQLTDRATKYAILLIGLTFMAFFVFESLTRRPLHPMQYLLVGLSLVLFYLVLLALSEHIGFTAAWLAASLSGAVMNGIYLQAVLRGWRNSLLFVAWGAVFASWLRNKSYYSCRSPQKR